MAALASRSSGSEVPGRHRELIVRVYELVDTETKAILQLPRRFVMPCKKARIMKLGRLVLERRSVRNQPNEARHRRTGDNHNSILGRPGTPLLGTLLLGFERGRAIACMLLRYLGQVYRNNDPDSARTRRGIASGAPGFF
jgi:hypothetical protein